MSIRRFWAAAPGARCWPAPSTRFKDRKLRSCLIWAHARNNACFFYEAMGGRRVATRTTRLMGELTPEIGFGWKRLAARKQARTLPS